MSKIMMEEESERCQKEQEKKQIIREEEDCEGGDGFAGDFEQME